MELPPGKIIEQDWYESNQGKEFINCLLRKHKRRQFGVLERPTFPLGISSEILSYKIFMYGKAAVGKTSLICKLCGLDIPQMHHETPGLQTSTIYWPVKLASSNDVIIFKFMLYDVGEFALKKYNHFLPACLEKVDAVIFTFSFIDRASFDDLTNSVDNLVLPEKSALKVVVGTKYPNVHIHDQFMHSEISERELYEFEQNKKMAVFKMKNISCKLPDGSLDAWGNIRDTSPFLNSLGEQLFHRDRIAARHTRAS